MALRDELRSLGLRARKDLGQHWLVDEGVVQRIVEAASLSKSDTVVEIGPGPGILTPHLAEQAGQVVAIELDEAMLAPLQQRTATFENIKIRQADVLGIDPAELPRSYQVVANVPYYITSAILRHFLETKHRPQSMTLTIQKEVAERVAAKPPKMSVLAVSVQLYGDPEIVEIVPASAFWPPPEVDSAVIRIDRIGTDLDKTLQGLDEETFFKVVKAGFAEKRKQLHNTLAHNLELSHEEATAFLDEAGIEPTRRAETLEVDEWVRLGIAYGKR